MMEENNIVKKVEVKFWRHEGRWRYDCDLLKIDGFCDDDLATLLDTEVNKAKEVLNSFTKTLTVNGTDASSYIEVQDFKCPGCKKHTWDELKPDWESKEVKLGERIYWWLFYTCSCGAKYRFIDSRVGEEWEWIKK